MEGAVSKRIRPHKDKLVDVIARLEAGIDFAEDDVDVPDNAAVVKAITLISAGLEKPERYL